MELSKGITIEYVDGAVVVKAEVKSLLLEELAKIKAKVESGEIDPIKGTDVDKSAILAALNLIEGAI